MEEIEQLKEVYSCKICFCDDRSLYKCPQCINLLCLACIESISKGQSEFNCPFCRGLVRVRDFIRADKLPGFDEIQNLLKHQKIYELCKKHKDEKISHYCIQCKLNLCPDCYINSKHAFHKVINLKNKREYFYNDLMENMNNLEEKAEANQQYINECQKEIALLKIRKTEENVVMSRILEAPQEYYDKKISNLVEFLNIIEDYFNYYKNLKADVDNLIEKKDLGEQETESIKERISEYRLLVEAIPDLRNLYCGIIEKGPNSKLKLPLEKDGETPGALQTTKKSAKSSIDNVHTTIKVSSTPKSITLLKYIIEKGSAVTSMCILKDGRLAASSSDKTIKIFNILSFICEVTITGHNDCVWHISVLANGHLLSTSYDTTLKIWEIKENKYSCIATLTGHTDRVTTGIKLSSNRIASCSDDKTIKIWSSTAPFTCKKTITEKDIVFNCIHELKNGSGIVCGSYWNPCLMLFDNKKYTTKKTLPEIDCWSTNCLLEVGDKMIVGRQNDVLIIKIDSFKIVGMVKESNSKCFYSFVQLGDNTILAGCKNLDNEGMILNFETKTFEIFSSQIAHENNITGFVNLEGSSLISSSLDGSIKVWKIE